MPWYTSTAAGAKSVRRRRRSVKNKTELTENIVKRRKGNEWKKRQRRSIKSKTEPIESVESGRKGNWWKKRGAVLLSKNDGAVVMAPGSLARCYIHAGSGVSEDFYPPSGDSDTRNLLYVSLPS
ncbi:hypothetical protein PM082_004946 [Marasmius tenuissimus]|nr:hypothetical protein PM082_004946 [Marasmius tenuissimus]